MDVVYLCRPGDNNEELRYSLRSLRNLPSHEQVWIFGGAPDWVNRNLVRVVEVPQAEFTFRDSWLTKYLNVRRNLATAVETVGVAEHFILMNDDFYLTEEIDTVPVLNYGTREEFDRYYLAKSRIPSQYVLAEYETMNWLQEVGIPEPLSYSLHVPLPVVKSAMAGVLETVPETFGNGQPAHLRTAYGNLLQIGGETVKDVKVERGQIRGVRRLNGQRIGYTDPKPVMPKPFASSSDRSFVNESFPIGKWIRALLPDPSVYEA